MLLNDTSTLDDFDKPAPDDDTDRVMNWDLENDNFLDSLLKMENDSTPFGFLSSNDDFMSSAATTPRSYDNAESSSCSDSGTLLKHSHCPSLRQIIITCNMLTHIAQMIVWLTIWFSIQFSINHPQIYFIN